MKDIPVILMTYNRPWHTAQVLKALKRSDIQNLYVFSDGSRSAKDVAPVLETRRLLEEITWTRPTIVCREVNLGLAKSIVSAVNAVFAKHDRLILLEDDCVPKEYFFDFMARCLSKYENNERIFGVNGYTVPIPDDLLRGWPFDIYFYPRIGSWGWATWKRAWAHFDTDLSRLYSRALAEGIDLCQAGADIPSQVQRVLSGQLDAWTLNWVLTVYLNNGCYIYPTVSQIQNIGFDGSGVHCGRSSKFANFSANKHLKRLPEGVVFNKDLIENYNGYFAPESKSKAVYDYNSRHRDKPKINRARQNWTVKKSSAKLSIVHINTHDVAGGAAKVGWRLAETQRKTGHDSKILVGSKKSKSEHSFSFPLEIEQPMYESCLRQGQLFYAPQGSHKLTKNELVLTADILHLHNLHGGYFNPFSLSALSHFKPVVWTLHDMQAITGHCAYSVRCPRWQDGCRECPTLNLEHALYVDTSGRLLRDKKLIYDHSHLWLVTPSQWLKNKVGKSVLRDHPVELIYNGIDTEVFKPCDKKEARAGFGIPANALVIGAVANGGTLANHWKGGQYTQAALDALRGGLPNCVFVNIGTKHPGDDPGVIDIGHIDNEDRLARAYSAFDIFLSTPLADNCPLVVIEALACGAPVVSFDTGGVPELVRDGLDGFVTEYKNVPQIVRAVQRLAAAPALRAEQSRNARQRAVSNFDHKVTAERYENLYRRVLAKSATPRKEVKLFPLPKVPEVVKTDAFMEAEKCKADIIAQRAQPAPGGVDSHEPQIEVSIILCTKDRAALLDKMLASLNEAVAGTTWEMIVVEGGSSDNTLDVLHKHGVKNVYSEAQCLGPGRHSWPQLYNFGFSKAHGKWAMYASDDIVFGKGCITKALEQLNRQKEEVAGGIFFFKNVHAKPGWDNFAIGFTYGTRLLMNYGLVRLDSFRAVGGLDERYNFYYADGDFCNKLYETGKQLIPLPDCFVVHNNVIDVQKKEYLDGSAVDFEFFVQRWKHFSSAEKPYPRHLLWQQCFYGAFNLPSSLPTINSGIEHFWRAIGYMQGKDFVNAAASFTNAINEGCHHWQVVWCLAQAAYGSRNLDVAEEAARLVNKMTTEVKEVSSFITQLKAIRSGRKPVPTKFIILFNGRSAGTLFSRSLNNHPNIFCLPERIFYMSWEQQLAKIKECHSRLFPEILAGGLITKLAAFKPEKYGNLLDYINTNSVKVIHLYRENPIKQAFSKYVADILYKEKQLFNIYEEKQRITPLDIDFELFMEHLTYTSEFERRLFCFMQKVNLKKQISFERFIDSKERILKEVQAWLQVPYQNGIIEPTKKVVSGELTESITNYDEFEGKLNNLLSNYPVLKQKKDYLFSHYLEKKNIFAEADCMTVG